MKTRILFYSFLLFFQFVIGANLQAQERKNPFLVEWDDAIQRLSPGDTYALKVKFQVPDHHYLYADKTLITINGLAGLQIIDKKIPAGQMKLDPFSKKEENVYLNDIEIVYNYKVPTNIEEGRKTLEGEIRYQGCSADFCYRPMKVNLLVPLEISSKKNTTPSTLNPSEEGKKKSL